MKVIKNVWWIYIVTIIIKRMCHRDTEWNGAAAAVTSTEHPLVCSHSSHPHSYQNLDTFHYPITPGCRGCEKNSPVFLFLHNVNVFTRLELLEKQNHWGIKLGKARTGIHIAIPSVRKRCSGMVCVKTEHTSPENVMYYLILVLQNSKFGVFI